MIYLLALLLIIPQVLSAYTFQDIVVPGSSCSSAAQINDKGEIVGFYCEGVLVRGFFWRKGQFDFIDHPEATRGTSAFGINNKTQIVGQYVNETTGRGFLLSKGKFTDIDPPGSTGSVAVDISRDGAIVGNWVDANERLSGFYFENGVYTTIDFGPEASHTMALGVNDRGQVVGLYVAESTLIGHGFVWKNGVFETIDHPDAAANTDIADINNRQQMVGAHDGESDLEGFILEGDQFTRFVVPGAISTQPTGINRRGDIVGEYSPSVGVRRGFLAIEKQNKRKKTQGVN